MSPYDLVAKALDCDVGTLHEYSGLHSHPEWDSFGHLKIVIALEQELQLVIDDDHILELTNMREVSAFWDKHEVNQGKE